MDERERLAQLINDKGLATVMGAIAEICYGNAETTINSGTHDKEGMKLVSRMWSRAAVEIENVANRLSL